jgi:hypothetical protein
MTKDLAGGSANAEIALGSLPLARLFSMYRGILAELRLRGVVRTENAPAGDYAEYLVATAFRAELAPNSEKSWDVRLADGARIQVKARVVSDPIKASQRQLSPFRSFDFDDAIIVFLSDGDYSVRQAARVPRAVVQAAATYNKHVGGDIAFARPQLMNHEKATDITDVLRRVTDLGIHTPPPSTTA